MLLATSGFTRAYGGFLDEKTFCAHYFEQAAENDHRRGTNSNASNEMCCKMLAAGRDICFALAFIFTIVALLARVPCKQYRVPEPKPFFEESPWVTDAFSGELHKSLRGANKYDVSLILLYSPWDAQSQNMRNEFESTCKFYHSKVNCVATNCWHHGGHCRDYFGHISSFPIILLNAAGAQSLTYTGLFYASHMIAFINSVLYPLQRVDSVRSFYFLRNMKDHLVIAYVPLLKSESEKWYSIYYAASLKHLEVDPRRDVCWSIITDDNLAQELDFQVRSLKLFQWNTTTEFTGPFVTNRITNWVSEAVFSFPLTRWVHSDYRRNSVVASVAESAPTLMLFTPRNLYASFSMYYLLLREVAIAYYSCEHKNELQNRLQYITKERFGYAKRLSNLSWNCRSVVMSENFCMRSTFKNGNPVLPEENKCSSRVTNCSTRCEPSNDPHPFLNICQTQNFGNMYSNWAKRSSSSEYLAYADCIDECRRIREMNRWFSLSYSSYLRNEVSDTLSSIAGLPIDSLYCRSEIPMAFIAIDSITNVEYAERLGINLTKYVDRTAFVIFDPKEEAVHVLNSSTVDKLSLSQFVLDYTNSRLDRWYKVASPLELPRASNVSDTLPERNTTFVAEINGKMFRSHVLHQSKHVAVYYYSMSCAYCQICSHRFLEVAHLLRKFPEISFLRIDIENNDLPWQFVPDKLPALILFPAWSKSNSKVFPDSKRFTTKNVLEFVVHNLDDKTRILSTLTLCMDNIVSASDLKNEQSDEDREEREDEEEENDYAHNENIVSHSLDECISEVKQDCLQSMDKTVRVYKKLLSKSAFQNVNLLPHLEKLTNSLKFLKRTYKYLQSVPSTGLNLDDFLLVESAYP